jgi:transposase-like protein
MDIELTDILGRQRYQRIAGKSNHRNGSYPRKYTLKGIREVAARIPRDRKGEFETQVIPRSKQYEDALREDICAMFLSGVSTRTLSLVSDKLIGRKISPTEVSRPASS